MVSQLQNLNELKKDGFFTEDEFTQVKQVVMLPFLTQNNIHAQQSHFQDQSQTLKEQELNRERYLLNNGDGGLLNVVENDDSHCSSGGGGGGGSSSCIISGRRVVLMLVLVLLLAMYARKYSWIKIFIVLLTYEFFTPAKCTSTFKIEKGCFLESNTSANN